MMPLAVESFWRRLCYTRLRDVFRGQIDGQLDWQYPLAEANLPEEVTDTISQIVRKARLWKREQHDVASELASHFQDGLEAGRSAEQLVADFGDVAQAAKLIRRAKRRGRPLLWQAWWWAKCSLTTMFVGYVTLAFLLAFDRPQVTTDYLAIVNRSIDVIPKEERAWPHYRNALEWLKTNTKPVKGSVGIKNPETMKKITVEFWLNGPKDGETDLLSEYPNLNKGQRETVDNWLEERAEFLVLLRKATGYRYLGRTYGNYSARDRQLFGLNPLKNKTSKKEFFRSNPMYTTLLPHVQASRGLSRALKADLHRMVNKDDGASAFANLKAMIELARHYGEGPWLIVGLVKCGLLESAIESIEIVLTSQSELWTDSQLAEAAHLLGAVRLEVRDYVQGEKTSFDDFVQRIYSDDGNGDGYLTAEGIRLLDRELKPLLGISGSLNEPHLAGWQYFAATPAAYFVAASRQELLAKSHEMWARLQAAADRPLWDPLPRKETADGQMQQISQIEKYRYAPLLMCLPAYQAAVTRHEYTKGRREGALVGITLELYRREHGKWPESLDQLSPRWLPEVPIDRINGGPLGYRHSENAVVVYSLGTDTDDDEGRRSELAGQCNVHSPSPITEETSPFDARQQDGDWVIWSTEKEVPQEF